MAGAGSGGRDGSGRVSGVLVERRVTDAMASEGVVGAKPWRARPTSCLAPACRAGPPTTGRIPRLPQYVPPLQRPLSGICCPPSPRLPHTPLTVAAPTMAPRPSITGFDPKKFAAAAGRGTTGDPWAR